MATLAQRITDLAAAVRVKINAIMPRLLPPGGAANSYLRKTSASNYAVEWAPDPWTYIKLGSDFSTAATASSDVNGLSFALAANKTYIVEGVLMVRTSNTAAGVYLGAAGPTNITDQVIHLRVGREYESEEIAYSTGIGPVVSSPLSHFNTTGSYHSKVSALIVTGASAPNANFRITLASETAARTVTIKAGSYIRWREI